MDTVLLVIPARGGSKGLPGKNLAQVGGRSLVARAAAAARAWCERRPDLSTRIVVDTDDPAIADAARAAGAEVPFLREAAYAADETPTATSVIRLLDRLALEGVTPAHLVLLQPTSPLRTADDIAAVWEVYVANGHSAVSLSALGRPATQLVHMDAERRLHWLVGPPPPSSRRQDAPEPWFPNGAVYCIGAETLRAELRFVVPGRTAGAPMPPWRSVDVDDAATLRFADLLARSPDLLMESEP